MLVIEYVFDCGYRVEYPVPEKRKVKARIRKTDEAANMIHAAFCRTCNPLPQEYEDEYDTN